MTLYLDESAQVQRQGFQLDQALGIVDLTGTAQETAQGLVAVVVVALVAVVG